MSDHAGRVWQFKRRWHDADRKGLKGHRTEYAIRPLLEALDRAGAPPAYSGVDSVAHEVRNMAEQGIPREVVEQALDRVYSAS